jgi:hypothetical protein
MTLKEELFKFFAVKDQVYSPVDEVITDTKFVAPLYKDIRSFYGDAVADASNQVVFVSPVPMCIAWNVNHYVGNFLCHSKVAESLYNILVDLKYTYGIEQLEKLGVNVFGGCYNYQRVRNGNRFCTHSWGIALSLNPQKNRYDDDVTKALFAKPEYKQLIDTFYKYGWFNEGVELGKNFGHFQAVRYK